MSLNKLSIAAKLWTAVVVLILVLLAVLAGTGINSARINAQVQADFGQLLKKSDLVKQWASYTTLNVNRLQASMLSSDPAVDAFFKGRVADTIGQITELNKAIEAIGLDDEEKAQMAQIGALRQKVLDELATTRKIKEGGDHAAAVAHINGPFDAAIQPYLAALKTYEGLQGRKLEQAQQAAATERAANTRNAAFVVGVILLGIVAGATYLVRNIRQPLRQTVDFAEQIAAGDLTARLAMNRQDEFGAMQTALNTMRDQLVHVVSDVRRGTDNITVASQEIASGNHDLSARTEQTASSLEETAASMEEMSGAIKQAADSARVANQLADVAGASAQRGGEVVGQVVTTMQDINEASRKIGEIISVIDGIAFQTNILALNAAVEAARAGEQGRGFAVVAGEVRNLAQRSAQAAKEIKELINNSVNRVGAGTQLVSQAGETMKEIVENVVRVRDIIGEIASSSAEQAEGVNQINAAIANLDQMTQQNAALVEQSAAAASSMSEQAGQLSQVVQTFRLNPADLQNSGIAPQAAAPTSAAKAARPAAAPRVSAPAPAPTRLAKPAARPVPAAPAAPATPARLPRAAAPATSVQGDTGEWESF